MCNYDQILKRIGKIGDLDEELSERIFVSLRDDFPGMPLTNPNVCDNATFGFGINDSDIRYLNFIILELVIAIFALQLSK